MISKIEKSLILKFMVLGTMTIIPIYINPQIVYAQNDNINQNTNTLVVNPDQGNDRNEGATKSPLKTITQALKLSQPNTIILLQPGKYNQQNGEKFPLILKPKVTIQGNSNNRGKNIIIQGGGKYISPIAGEQNITIVSENKSILIGVTITNPTERGYGVWIESSNSIIMNNTLINNDQDAISIHGYSKAIIGSNYIANNGGNGITIYGVAEPEIKDNVISNTKFGIIVAQNSAPQLTSNKISNNQDGIVVEGRAKPILRNNIITKNKRDGIVAIFHGLPDLGTSNNQGKNIFEKNGRFDINNKTASNIISAFGNNITMPIQGKIDILGDYSVAKLPKFDNSVRKNSNVKTPSSVINNSVLPKVDNSASNNNNVKTPPSPITNNVITPGKNTQKSLNTQPITTEQKEQNNVKPKVIEINITPPEPLPSKTPTNNFNSQLGPQKNKQIPVFNQNPTPNQVNGEKIPDILPVPSANIPVGTPVNKIIPPPSSQQIGLSGTEKKSYRVLVEVNNINEEKKVRSLISDAFFTTYQGRKMLQLGTFNQRSLAEDMLEELRDQGIMAIIDN